MILQWRQIFLTEALTFIVLSTLGRSPCFGASRDFTGGGSILWYRGTPGPEQPDASGQQAVFIVFATGQFEGRAARAA